MWRGRSKKGFHPTIRACLRLVGTRTPKVSLPETNIAEILSEAEAARCHRSRVSQEKKKGGMWEREEWFACLVLSFFYRKKCWCVVDNYLFLLSICLVKGTKSKTQRRSQAIFPITVFSFKGRNNLAGRCKNWQPGKYFGQRFLPIYTVRNAKFVMFVK